MAGPNLNPAVESGPWRRGINSLEEPLNLSDEQVQWSVNTINRGGVYQTRPGFVENDSFKSLYRSRWPRGIKLFMPLNKEPILVAAIGTILAYSAYPFTSWNTVVTTLGESHSQVTMEVCVKGAATSSNGVLSALGEASYPVLIVQTGETKPIVWDGIGDPFFSDQIPIFNHMKWIGNRLWGAVGNLIQVSNILDPLLFTEGDIVAEGGHFNLPGEITGLGATFDQQSLLAFTSTTTTSFQSGILQREDWLTTKDFKKILFPDIGCVAPNTIVNQYGMVMWMSQKGLIALDDALQTYHSSRIRVKDSAMARSKSNLSNNVSRSCSGVFGNIFMLSVPSGDLHNAHTWVMDGEILDTLDELLPAQWVSTWTGIRPIQWLTAEIKGQTRCFTIAYNPVAGATTGFTRTGDAGIWEAFCGTKQDLSGTNYSVIKNPPCSLETKFLGWSPQYKTFGYIDIELTQIEGAAHVDVYYASTHSGYKKVLSKNIVATKDSLKLNVPIPNIAGSVNTYSHQSRTIRSSNDVAQLSDFDAGVEAGETRNKSRAFSVLVNWTGQLAVRKVQLFTIPATDQMDGRVEKDEITDRYLLPTGQGAILTTLSSTAIPLDGLTSRPLVSISSRVAEEVYHSNNNL